MNKKIMVMTMILIFLFPLKAYATTVPTVLINVDGNIQNGQEVSILVNMKELEGLYAASVDFTYDKNDLKILSITAGDSIKKYEDEIMELGGEVDESNNKTSYSFTFLGDKKGIFGDGTLAIIKVKLLNADNFKIDKDSMKVKLVKRTEDGVGNYDYKFTGYSYDVSKPNMQESTIGSGSQENSSTEQNNKDTQDNNLLVESNTSGNNTSSSELNDNTTQSSSSDNKEEVKQENLENNKNDEVNIEASKHNYYIYILILLFVVCVACYYYKFRKTKAKNN